MLLTKHSQLLSIQGASGSSSFLKQLLKLMTNDYIKLIGIKDSMDNFSEN